MPKISQYTAVTMPQDADVLVVVQGGATKKVSLNTLKASISKVKEIIKTATGDLTAVEISGTLINNYGQAADVVLTLPVAVSGLSFMVVCGTTVANYYRIKANINDKIYLDGTAGADNGYVGIASAAVGATITFMAFQTGAEAYDWIATVISGNWVAG